MSLASGRSLVDDSAEASDDADRSEGRRQEVVADRTSVIGDVHNAVGALFRFKPHISPR